MVDTASKKGKGSTVAAGILGVAAGATAATLMNKDNRKKLGDFISDVRKNAKEIEEKGGRAIKRAAKKIKK